MNLFNQLSLIYGGCSIVQKIYASVEDNDNGFHDPVILITLFEMVTAAINQMDDNEHEESIRILVKDGFLLKLVLVALRAQAFTQSRSQNLLKIARSFIEIILNAARQKMQKFFDQCDEADLMRVALKVTKKYKFEDEVMEQMSKVLEESIGARGDLGSGRQRDLEETSRSQLSFKMQNSEIEPKTLKFTIIDQPKDIPASPQFGHVSKSQIY